MNIQQEVDKITRDQIMKQLKPIRPKIELAVSRYLNSKEFTKALNKAVREELDDHIFGDGALGCLPEREVDSLSKKAIRSLLK